MRFKLAPALFVSILLIGVASWARFTTSHRGSSNLIAVAQPAASVDNQALIDSYLPQASTSQATAQQETLTNTDLIGRGLISDYVDLAANGQDTNTSVNALADKYVQSVPSLTQAETVSLTDIKTAPDTKSSYQNYGDALVKIENDYRGKISNASGGKDFSTLGPAFYSLANTMSLTYKSAATKLEALPVPPLLAELHIKLINNYLSSAAATKALSETDKDPALSFSGITVLNTNVNDEDTILNKMNQIIVANGI